MTCLMKRISFRLLLAAVALMLCGSTQSLFAQQFTVNGKRVTASRYQAYKLVNESIKLMQQNRADLAANQLKRALQLDPALAEARGMLGIALARLGKAEEATEHMRIAVVNHPDLLGPRVNLGALYQSSGKTDEALAIYKQLVTDFPDNKMTPALQERIVLLDREMKRQRKARHETHADESSESSYFGNVTGQGRKRWPASSMPIRVYIYPGDGLNGYKESYGQILRESFSEWQSASNGKVSFVFQRTPHDADITCTWIDDPKLLESSAEGGEAQVSTYFDAVVKSNVLLSLNETGSAFPFTDNLVRTLCLHEIGHSIGLLGHSARASDVLYCSAPIVDREDHLSPRDVATLALLYEKDVDGLSNVIAELDRKTHGNTINILRFGIVALVAICLAIGSVLVIAAKARGKKVRRKRATTT